MESNGKILHVRRSNGNLVSVDSAMARLKHQTLGPNLVQKAFDDIITNQGLSEEMLDQHLNERLEREDEQVSQNLRDNRRYADRNQEIFKQIDKCFDSREEF